MPRTLQALIRESGNAGSSGQSFRHHVTGAGSGTRMSDYTLDALTPISGVPPVEDPIADDTLAVITALLEAGPAFPLIRRTDPASVTAEVVSTTGGLGGSIAAASVAFGVGQVVVGVRFRGDYVPQGPPTVSTSLLTPGPPWPSASDPVEHRVAWAWPAVVVSGTDTWQWRLRYVPGHHGYNPITVSPTYTHAVGRRARDDSSLEAQWAADAGGVPGTILSTGPRTFSLFTLAGASASVWTRVRVDGGAWGSWQLAGVLDPRPAV